MDQTVKQLEALRRRIADRNDPGMPADHTDRLSVTAAADDGAVDLDFHGDSFGESYLDLLSTVARPDTAAHVRSLILRGPDVGANGTHNWDLEPLLAGDADFPRLETLAIQQNRPGDHNRSIIGTDYDEDGVLGRLLGKAPALRELTAPSAPAANFFDVGSRPLRFLSVDAGYDTQSFIRNLARSTAFARLSCLEWGEYNETEMEDFRSSCTHLQDYHDLFGSTAFAPVKRFVWRNPICSAEEVAALKQRRPDLQLLVIRASAEYL
jgi:hypothetical protein